MQALLQLGTLSLLLGSLLTPLVEFFDRWDPPGPGNDTELALLGLILALCLVLLVAKLTAALAILIRLVAFSHLPPRCLSRLCKDHFVDSFLQIQTSPPLRI